MFLGLMQDAGLYGWGGSGWSHRAQPLGLARVVLPILNDCPKRIAKQSHSIALASFEHIDKSRAARGDRCTTRVWKTLAP